MRSSAGFPIYVFPPGSDLDTTEAPKIVVSSPIVTLGLTPTFPSRVTRSPIIAFPAIPTCAANRQFFLQRLHGQYVPGNLA